MWTSFDGGSSLVDVSSAPSALEQRLGRLIDAGIADGGDLASALGLQAQHVGRPLTKLTLAGVLEREPSGDLRVTPAGRTWLSIEATPGPPELVSPPERSAAPRLLLAQVAVDEDPDVERVQGAEDRAAPDVGGGKVAVARSHEGWTPPRIVARVRKTLGSVRRAMPEVPVAMPAFRLVWPRVQLTVEDRALSTSTVRRIAAMTASAVVLLTAVRLAVPAWPSTSNALPIGVGEVHEDAPPVANAPVATPPRPTPANTPSERWVIVSHTNGVGLVLRPAPAANARILTLADGARLRITGQSVQQAGRAWLPVASQSGKTGWVASDFVASEP
jgi:hypothetical protein